MNDVNEKWKTLTFALCLQLAILLSACTAFQVGGEIVKGRSELLHGDPKAALARFQRVAELDPDYRLNFTILRQGVWTYIGRANYATGNLPEARKALERARSRDAADDLAKLYLGLVLGRDEDQRRGLRELEAGLRGIADWLDYIEQYHRSGHYWDPTKKIRNESRRNLAMIKGQDVNWKELTQNIEWIGREIELEIDRAWEHERLDRERDGDRRRRR
ncbi:MAG: tetratricopeptide repeat protein [Candidatus Binatia bacterium]